MDAIVLWDLVIACNTCGWNSIIEDMYLVPDLGKIVCKACYLREETQVVEMAETDIGNIDTDW